MTNPLVKYIISPLLNVIIISSSIGSFLINMVSFLITAPIGLVALATIKLQSYINNIVLKILLGLVTALSMAAIFALNTLISKVTSTVESAASLLNYLKVYIYYKQTIPQNYTRFNLSFLKNTLSLSLKLPIDITMGALHLTIWPIASVIFNKRFDNYFMKTFAAIEKAAKLVSNAISEVIFSPVTALLYLNRSITNIFKKSKSNEEEKDINEKDMIEITPIEDPFSYTHQPFNANHSNIDEFEQLDKLFSTRHINTHEPFNANHSRTMLFSDDNSKFTIYELEQDDKDLFSTMHRKLALN